MYFIGLDLAWSEKNNTGLTILHFNGQQAKIVECSVVKSTNEIFSVIEPYLGQTKVIAIDAPLIVPNMEGSRIAEKNLNKEFRMFHAGAHPSNRTRLSSWSGYIRGEYISEKLMNDFGFTQNFLKSSQLLSAKVICEVFPHAANVSLFNLSRIFKYKAKKNLSYEQRYVEFSKYITSIKKLNTFIPSLDTDYSLLFEDFTKYKGKSLKDFEDKLDSIICAYVGLYYWFDVSKVTIYGNLEEGYILTPSKT